MSSVRLEEAELIGRLKPPLPKRIRKESYWEAKASPTHERVLPV